MPPPEPGPVLPLIVESEIVSCAVSLRMAPPRIAAVVLDAALPAVNVSPEIETGPPAGLGFRSKIRCASLPLIVILSAPGPLIARASVIVGRSLARVIVPLSPEAKLIVSGPELPLALEIAARSVVWPPSVGSRRLLTLQVHAA